MDEDDLFDDPEDFDEFADLTENDIEEAGYIADDDLSELLRGATR